MPREARLKRLLILAVAAAALAVAREPLFSLIRDYLAVADRAEAVFRFRVVMAGFGLSLLPAVAYFAAQAYGIAASGRFPPPGTRVWRDTPVVRGRAASLRAGGAAILAAALLGCAIYAQFLPQWLGSSDAQPSKSSAARSADRPGTPAAVHGPR